MVSLKWLVSGALTALCLPLFSASAQFNAIYGVTNGADAGRAVHQLKYGQYAGNFVSVGETPQPNLPGETDAYVVITNGAGARVNEYRINIMNGSDYATDFVEKENGNIVIVGHFSPIPDYPTDIFALELELSTGNLIWAYDYAGSAPSGNNNDEAYDIEMTTDGEFVIAGRSNSLHPNHTDAILMKIDENGMWRWGTAFDGGTGSSNEGFFSVSSVGDGSMVAGGYTTVGGNTDILLVRVNGFANTISAARFGGSANEGVRCVKVCDQAGVANANRVVLAGNTGSNALVALVDYTTMTWVTGNTYKTAQADWTEAMGVVETPAPERAFVITGLTLHPLGNKNFEFYLARLSTNLSAVNWYRVHGGNSDDYGWGVDLATPIAGELYSVIATGFRTTNAAGQQLDITRTSQGGIMPCNVAAVPQINPFLPTRNLLTNCQQLWGLLVEPMLFTPTRVTNTPVFCPADNFRAHPEEKAQTPETVAGGAYDGIIGNRPADDPQLHTSGAELWNDREIVSNAFPNPVKRGSTFNIDCTLPVASEIALSVSDVSGKEIYRTVNNGTAGENRLDVSTAGWSSGTYLVRMTMGDRTITRKIVVSD